MYNKLCIVIAPTNSCNLKCDYCYNSDLLIHNSKSIDIKTVKYIIDTCFKEYQYVDFVWRGGEPLLVNRIFYRKVFLEQLKSSYKYGTQFYNSIQTNGTLIDKKWARFFKACRFGVGISFDGYKNDIHRGLSDKTIQGIKLCQNIKIHIGCISVITPDNLDLMSLYTYLTKELKLSSLKFTPCFKTTSSNYTLEVNQYVDKLINLFEYWLHDTNRVELKPIIDYVRGIFGVYNIRECVNTGCLGRFLDIDSLGQIRICSHISDEKFVLGNFYDYDSVSTIFSNDYFNDILRIMIEHRKKCAAECELFNFCQGGCCANVYRQQYYGDKDFTCSVNKIILPYISSRIKSIIECKEDLSKYNPVFVEVVKEAICNNPICLSYRDDS